MKFLGTKPRWGGQALVKKVGTAVWGGGAGQNFCCLGGTTSPLGKNPAHGGELDCTKRFFFVSLAKQTIFLLHVMHFLHTL